MDHEDKRHTLNEKKRKLLTQAEQMKSPNNTTEIPDVRMAYSDHGLRAAKEKGGETAILKEEFREEDTHRYAFVRKSQKSHGVMIYNY